jgi:hypothetical protein
VAGAANSSYGGAILPRATTDYWRVRSANTAGDHSAWSAVRKVRIAFAVPAPTAPADGASVGTRRPTFTWTLGPGATGYQIQIAKVNTFKTVVMDKTVTGVTTFTPAVNLPANVTLYWRVRATGATYGPGAWSAVRSLLIPTV